MTKKELVMKFKQICYELEAPWSVLYHGFDWYLLNKYTLQQIIKYLQELLGYRTGIIQTKDIDDSLLSDISSLCKMILDNNGQVSQYKMAQSVLEGLK